MPEERDTFDKISINLLVKLLGSLLGVVAAVVTIYTAFFQEKGIEVQYVITANTNVLDINANVGKLDIVYDSSNLKELNSNLKILSIQVINNGSEDVLKGFFDENEPLGLKITDGVIIEKPELTETSSDYLQNNLRIQYGDNSQVTFSQTILEKKEFFVIRLLILHENEKNPKVLPIGKIAGQKKIDIINSTEIKEERPFLVETFSGNIWVQFVRLLSYLGGLILFLILFFVIVTWIEDIRTNRKREKNIEDFKGYRDYDHNKMNDAIFDRYLDNGSTPFVDMKRLIMSEKVLNNTYKEGLARLKKKSSDERINSKKRRVLDYEHLDWITIQEMLNDGLIIKEESKLIINQPMKTCLFKFIDFLEEQGDYDKYKIESPLVLEDQ